MRWIIQVKKKKATNTWQTELISQNAFKGEKNNSTNLSSDLLMNAMAYVPNTYTHEKTAE